MAVYGKTWWGKRWLETFTGIDNDNRLPRGRTYANTGRAYDIRINGNVITAKVTGSRPRPYKVEIMLHPFGTREKEEIHQVIVASPTILSALINRKLPSQLLEKLSQQKIKLFPTHWREIKASCSCPDWAMPCKHIAAVIYLICAEIDKNPFTIFHIHNCDLLSLIDDFSDGQLNNARKLPQIEELFVPCSLENFSPEQNILDEMGFSKITDLSKHIITILQDDPPFYDKNFREVLHLAYKHWQRYPRGQTSKNLFISQPIIKSKQKKEISEDEAFSAKWGCPERWNAFNLRLDNAYSLVGIFNNETQIFKESKNLISTLVMFLSEMPNSILHKLCPELRLVHMIFQFSVKLMESSAFIPQILQNKDGAILIRWIPALFDTEVQSIYSQLCRCCSQNLVSYQKVILNPEEQIKAVISIILSGLIYDNLPSPLAKNNRIPLFTLFFLQARYIFKEFANKELPYSINQWLSNLYISERRHKLYLKVEDKHDEFHITLQVSLDGKSAPIPLQKVLKTKDAGIKLSILSDLSLVSDYMPNLSSVIDHGTAASFKLEDFAPLFLNILPVLKAIGLMIILPKSLQKILKPQLNLSLKSKDKLTDDRKSFLNLENLLEFNWKVAIGDNKVSIEQFKDMIKNARGLVKIFDEYVLLDEKEMQSLLKQMEKLPTHLSQEEATQALLAGEWNGASVDIDEQLRALLDKLNKYDKVLIPQNLCAQLRPYQERGFSWLIQNMITGFGSILADDMGLGKTLQVITAILHMKNEGWVEAGQPVLVITPTSLLSNWQKEIEKFAPVLKSWIYHGQNRDLLREYDILITSYGLARREKKELNKINWLLLVIDEAQNIKNPHAEQTKAIKSIKAQYRIAMSGTPVENRLLEYWSIFDFTNKNYLGTPVQFRNQYALPIERSRDKDSLNRFKKITSPFILRRLKSDKSIIADLPEKIENNRYCSLTSKQAALYQEIVDASIKKIETSEGIERKGLVLKLINALKQICNHPSQFAKKSQATIDQSGKTMMLEEILIEIEQRAEKSLIFTQYVEMGKIIAKLLEERFGSHIPFLHGSLSRNMRDEMVCDFQNSSNTRTLIISLKAGGTGLNLTAASHVIHYDLWWNPAVENQATDRAYRIGQKNKVIVHRLLATGTFEERIDAMIKSKKELADLTVGSGESWITEMSTEQIKNLVTLRPF